jgi:hypothetical protein
MTTTKLAGRLAEIMGSIGGVEKKGKITSTGSGPTYKFARDADVLLTVIPKMAAAGIVMVPEHVELISIVLNMRETQQIATVKVHWLVTDGTEELRFESLGMGQDSGDKSLPKAQTNARKYGLFMLLHIVTGDDPDEWASLSGAVDADDDLPALPRRPPIAPFAIEEVRDRIFDVMRERNLDAKAMEPYADQVGIKKGGRGTLEQLQRMLALIERPAREPAAAEGTDGVVPTFVAVPPPSIEAGQSGEASPASLGPSDPASSQPGLLDAVLETTGGSVLPENPAAPAIAKARAKAAASKVPA